MAYEYFLATTFEYFRKVVGSANNPSNPTNAQNPPGVAGGAAGFFSAWSQDGLDLWFGGDAWTSPESDSSTLWRSQNGGSIWTNEYTKHPDGGSGEIYDFWGFGSGTNLWACGDVSSGNSKILKWTGSTWSAASPGGFDFGASSRRTNSLWGTSASEMYCVSKTAAGNSLMRNLGAGWVGEGVGAGSLRAALVSDGGGDPIAITGDGTNLWVWCQTPSLGGYNVYRGVYGGPWAYETASWSTSFAHDFAAGKILMADELGAIWLFGSYPSGYEVHRRNPTSGTWALSRQLVASVGAVGGIFVTSSESILVASTNYISMYDGSSWYDYNTNSRWGWVLGDRAVGIWGYNSAIPVVSTVSIDRIAPVARDIIKVKFTGSVAITSSLLDKDNYLFLPATLTVKEVISISSGTTDEIFLILNPRATAGNSYQLTIPSADGAIEYVQGSTFPSTVIFTPSGEPLALMSATWLHYWTKTDTVLQSLAGMYSKKVGSNIRSILEAITISDEEIGGGS